MKKRISITIIVALLMLAVLTITASAAGITATTDTKSCAQNNIVTLDVKLSGSVNVAAGAVEVVYDKTKLQLIEGAWNTPGAPLAHYDLATNKGAFAFASSTGVSGTIFSVKFKVLSNAPIGETEVKCIIQLKDASSNDIAVTSVSGKINVTCNHSFTEKTNNYLASPASCTSAAKYYYSCSACGAKGTSTYTVGAPGSHTYNKQVTTQTYLVTSVDCVNTAEYYYSCECGAKGSEKFTGDASWTHNFSNSWFVGASSHWHGCLDCGAKKDEGIHSPNADGVCGQCQFVLSNDGTHYHSFGNVWASNSDAHWHECSCGLKNDMELHNWNDGVVTKPATNEKAGEKLYTCSDCGETKTKAVDKLNSENTGMESGNKTDDSLSTGKIILIAAAGMAILLIIEAVAFVVYKFIIMKKQPVITEEVSEPEETTENIPENDDSQESDESNNS